MKHKFLLITLGIISLVYHEKTLGIQVTFSVDLSVYANASIFNPVYDSVFVRASFNNWTTSNPMTDPENDLIYTANVSLDQNSYYEYKFWINTPIAPNGGWEDWLVGNGGPYGNRTLTTGNLDTILVTVYFNNLAFIPQEDPAILCYSESNYKREPNVSPYGDQITFYYSEISNFDGPRFPTLAEIDENFSAINVRPITDNTSGIFRDWDPVFRKPDGNEIYFTTDRYVYWDIMKYDQQTQIESFVFRWGAYYAINNLRFSPDGSKFVCDGDTPGGHYLMVFNADGSNPQTLFSLPNGIGIYQPDWSPDGNKLLIAIKDTIYTVDIYNPILQYTYSNNSGISHPKWSPDGNKIVFSTWKNGNGDIWIINSDGSDPYQLTTSIWDDVEPVWDGNRDRIYFLSTRWSLYQNIYSLPAPNSVTGLVAYYPFNGNAQDSSGNNNHGNQLGGVSWGNDRFGQSGKAVQLNGIDGYIEVPNSSSLQSPSEEITIAGWMYIEDFPGTEVAGIVMKTISNTHGQYGIGYQETIPPSSIYYVQNGELQGLNVPVTLDLQHWYFIAVTKDADDTVKIFLDGEVIGNGIIQEQIMPDNNPVVMGYETNGYPEYLNGKLDDVRIYNTALTESEILELYHENGWPNSSIQITSPTQGETWIVDTQEDITWISNNVNQINIRYSTNNGINWNTIVSAIPANQNSYAWTIPNLTSNQCKISISDVSNPNTYCESSLFTIKGWILTRITNGLYEEFDVNKDGWQFSQDIENMWPEEWWNNNPLFDYSSPPYPTGWPNFPIYARNYDYNDWPIFREVFGDNYCYWNTNIPIYNPFAIIQWRIDVNRCKFKESNGSWSPYNGACFGFAVTSLLAFRHRQELNDKFPYLTGFNNLHDVPITNESRLIINHLFMYQFTKRYFNHLDENQDKTPVETLDTLKHFFLEDNQEPRFLILDDSSPNVMHIVVPYKIEKSLTNPDIEYVYVYDSKNPGYNDLSVIIDKAEETWSFPIAGINGQSSGLLLGDPISNYLQNPIDPSLKNDGKTKSDKILSVGEHLIFNNSSYLDIIIKNSVGDSIGFIDTTIFNGFENGIPIKIASGNPHPPVGYYLPIDSYNIMINNYSDTISTFSVIDSSFVFKIDRRNLLLNSGDRFRYNPNQKVFTFINNQNIVKEIRLESLFEETSSSKLFTISECLSSENDTLNFMNISGERLEIQNNGYSKSYDLSLSYSDETIYSEFLHRDINITFGSIQQIAPDWMNFSNPVLIFIDLDGDGIFDDTLSINNQITNIINEGSDHIPTEYYLNQNYPNPFNPITTIKYQIPKPSFVSLKVYDILGDEVSTLINEEKPTGNYEIEFDGSDLSSGIYFYRLQAGDFIQTKKMILLK